MPIRDNYDQELTYLQQFNKHEDTLDVFINLILKRSPTVFVLINMTLMIWLVQTIFSSNLESIPRSIYLFSPFFITKPINHIIMATQSQCPNGYQQLFLKTFPKIKQEHINHIKMTKWGDEEDIVCIQRMKSDKKQELCPDNMIFCSGFCEQSKDQCPITDIKKIQVSQEMPEGYETFHTTKDHQWKFILSRENSIDLIVGLIASYENRCTNDFKYYDQYENFKKYWKQTRNCGGQGALNTEIYKVVDTMDTPQFLINNGVNSPFIASSTENSITQLGFIYQIKFKNHTQKCQHASLLAKKMDTYLFQDPVKPTFTRSLLIVAFIFFTGCWAWLVGYYCFEGKRKEKNIIVILMVIIEIIVVSFTYSQNNLLFETEKVVQSISGCLMTEFSASSHWNFGITSASPFLMILFACTSFLLLQIIANFLDYCVYEPYSYN